MSCTGCNDGCFDESVQLQQGPQGDTGAAGTDGTNGDSAYEIAVANGFVGTEAAWLASLNGVDATGLTLLKSITSEVEIVAASYASGNAFTHSVTGGTLNTNEDTLSFEGLVLNTKDDATLAGLNITFGGTTLIIGVIPSVQGYPNMEQQGAEALKIKVDIVRVSNTEVKIEAEITLLGYSIGDYASSAILLDANSSKIKRMGQTITGLNLTNTDYDFDVNLQTDSASRPTKLVQGKLILLNKG